MKNAKQLVPILAVLLCVSLSCTFLKDRVAKVGDGGDNSATIPNVPPFDPNGPMISPGAYVLRILAEEEPGVAVLASEIEAAEKRLMKRAIDESVKRAGSDKRNQTSSTLPSQGMKGMSSRPFLPNPVGAHLMLQSRELALPTVGDGAFFGGFTGFLKGMLAGALSDASFNKKETRTEEVEGGNSTMHAEIGVNPDGSSVFEIGIITETQKNGVKARTELKSRIEGQDCPNAEGQVPITIRLRLAGQSGKARYEQDVTAFVRLVIDDNAEISSRTIDVTQATARGRNGNNVFVETAFTYRRDGESDSTISDERLVRKSDNSTPADEHEAAMSGSVVALGAANAAIAAAKTAWQGGACIKIVATSPGTVDLNSSTAIPVKVIHKKEGTELAAKLESNLEGGASIDPTVIPKTAGTLTYVAPGESGKTATIKLTANSRRGRATLDLTASTGGNSYQIVGGLDDFQTSTKVCDIMKPFTLTGGGFTNKFSGGLSGTYNYTGPFQSEGSGTYSISLPEGPGKPGTMTGQGSGSVLGRYTGTGTEKYTLTPIEPCSE